MPHLYYIELSGNDYSKYFKDNSKEINKGMSYLYDFMSNNNNGTLANFLDGVLDVHFKNLDVLNNYDLYSGYVPNKDQSLEIFNKLRKLIKENDIISISNYRGDGQYYVYKEGDELHVTSHYGEYGRQYPPQSAKYFLDNRLYEYIADDNLTDIYTKYYVFQELHRYKLQKIHECPSFSICGSGIYIDTNMYNMKSSKNTSLNNSRYIVLDFYDRDDPDVDDIVLIDKNSSTNYNLRCVWYETDSIY